MLIQWECVFLSISSNLGSSTAEPKTEGGIGVEGEFLSSAVIQTVMFTTAPRTLSLCLNQSSNQSETSLRVIRQVALIHSTPLGFSPLPLPSSSLPNAANFTEFIWDQICPTSKEDFRSWMKRKDREEEEEKRSETSTCSHFNGLKMCSVSPI